MGVLEKIEKCVTAETGKCCFSNTIRARHEYEK